MMVQGHVHIQKARWLDGWPREVPRFYTSTTINYYMFNNIRFPVPVYTLYYSIF